jgi:hypothetical protein
MRVGLERGLACGKCGTHPNFAATQTLEPEMSILLKDDIVGLVAIGDPQQLPGVVLNRKLEFNGYSISLFERLVNAGSPHLLLTTQYRMHPDISQWPASTYYDG